jgi:hypothetical protein
VPFDELIFAKETLAPSVPTISTADTPEGTSAPKDNACAEKLRTQQLKKLKSVFI